jgi:predicted nucleic acid-binding protein
VTPLVVDASAAISWFVASQSGKRSAAFTERLTDFRIIAPDVFAWEMANLFRRFSAAGALDVDKAMASLELLDVQYSGPRSATEIYDLVAVAHGIGLSLFDTTYFLLAHETGAELVSRDTALLTAARAHAIPCHDLNEAKAP